MTLRESVSCVEVVTLTSTECTPPCPVTPRGVCVPSEVPARLCLWFLSISSALFCSISLVLGLLFPFKIFVGFRKRMGERGRERKRGGTDWVSRSLADSCAHPDRGRRAQPGGVGTAWGHRDSAPAAEPPGRASSCCVFFSTWFGFNLLSFLIC